MWIEWSHRPRPSEIRIKQAIEAEADTLVVACPFCLSTFDDAIKTLEYEDKIRGFAKDSIQNSWEARIHRKKGSDFKIIYKLFRQLDGYKNVLMFEDTGTVGMNDERWSAFHAHWQTTKGGSPAPAVPSSSHAGIPPGGALPPPSGSQLRRSRCSCYASN